MGEIAYLDKPPEGFFILEVMPRDDSGKYWSAIMVDYDPDDRSNLIGRLLMRECWVLVPGEHSCREDAWLALEDMLATRH